MGNAASPIRVAMFTELTPKNGSSRVMCYQYASPLRELGVNLQFFPPSSIRQYEFFCEKVSEPRWLVLLAKAIFWYLLVFSRRLGQIARAAAADVVYVQRGLLRYSSPPVLEWLLWLWAKKLWRRPMVYALDDAQYLVANPRYFHFRFRMADWVATGNEEIAAYARAFNPNIWLSGSAVDTRTLPPRKHRDRQPVVIGWAGTLLDSTGYLSLMRRVLPEIARRVPVVFEVVSNRPFDAGGDPRVIHRPWTLEGEAENLCCFDIGIMPLPDDDFTRAKEGYKLKQYMAAGLPVVCSPVGQNITLVREGVNGFLAHDEREWIDKLALLACDSSLRARMGEAGRRFVEEHYSLEVVAPHLAAFLHRLCPSRAAETAKPRAVSCPPRGEAD